MVVGKIRVFIFIFIYKSMFIAYVALHTYTGD